ncbi:MAG: RtcB family protein [Planctomycetota bacterium]|nr:RtcB family protein [Planctomycetota bacterium]
MTSENTSNEIGRSATWRQWGEDLESQAVAQMEAACRLPVAVAGALMPDAHVGYGLPIGGVLATDNAVIPFAVGVDSACRMRMTVLDIPVQRLGAERKRFERAIEEETRFGIGAAFKEARDHAVMDADWSVSPVTKSVREKARMQLGTSGSGNHFVEFGSLTLERADLGLEAGEYLALLTHSGSRGPGAKVADHYSRLAMSLRPDLAKEQKHLAWLDLDSAEGQEYWAAMELMGRFAAANHEVIHREMVKNLKAKALATVENHHNFAWKETHTLANGSTREVVVHRKGATPAGEGVLGVIPGSMATPGFVVRGKGSAAAPESASHGAGRVMSRTQAKKQFRWAHIKPLLRERGVTLMSAGLDENPFVYKDIGKVMAAQADLVEVVARFDPMLVKMAPEGERAED